MAKQSNEGVPVSDIKCLRCIHFEVCTHYIGGMNLQMASLDCNAFETYKGFYERLRKKMDGDTK